MKQKVMGIVDHLPEDKLKKLDHFIKHDLSTDEGSDHSLEEDISKIQKVDKEYFKSLRDKHNTSELLIDLIEHDFESIKEHLGFKVSDNVKILRELAINVCDKKYQNLHEIEPGVAHSIYGEAKTQLELLGEDVADIISHYDFV